MQKTQIFIVNIDDTGSNLVTNSSSYLLKCKFTSSVIPFSMETLIHMIFLCLCFLSVLRMVVFINAKYK